VDGDAADLELLVANTTQEVSLLRADRRLEGMDGSRGEALRQHVVDLLDALDLRIAAAPDSSAPDAVRRAFARTLRQCTIVLRGAHAALPWLAATREPNVNLGSLYLTEEFAKALVGDDVDLVVVPSAEAMYSTTSWPFSAVIDGTPGFTPSATSRPIVLNYPLSDSNRVLLHALFAHELGHAGVAEHELLDTVETSLYADGEFVEAFAEAVTEMQEEWPASTAGRVTVTLREILGGWLEELLCDHLATQVVGPAFLFAFAAFVLPLSYGEPGVVHPPTSLRVRLILDHLAHLGWTEHLDATAPGITQWLNEVANWTPPETQPHFAFFRNQLLSHSQLLSDNAATRVGPLTLDPTTAVDEAGEAAELLEALILPVGLSTPLSPRAILLGGWQAAISQHGDTATGLVHSIAGDQLHDLVGKAAELTTVWQAWGPSR